jgi:hypothetical protein
MPAKNPAQQRLMGLALSHKRGKSKKKPSAKIRKLMHSMSLKQLEDFASKPKKGFRT